MSSPIFRGFLLIGCLCLWVTPTEEKITITQDPKPAVVGADVILTLELEDISQADIKVATWYQSKQVETSKLISGRVVGNPATILTGTIDIAKDGATVLEKNGLKIPNFKPTNVNYYTVQVITSSKMETATILVISASNLCAMSSSVLLLAAVLFSSLRLL